MIPRDLADQLQAEVKSFKAVQDRFLETYQRLCIHCAGSDWRTEEVETVCHRVRREVIPIMEQEGMDAKAVEALCSWAERRLVER
jgi:hypothetical protein